MTALPIITNKQLGYLAFIIVFTTAILHTPTVTIKAAGNGGWVVPAIALAYGIIILVIVGGLYRRHPGQTLAQYSRIILGSWLGTLIGVLYGTFFWSTGFLVVQEIVSLIHTMLLPHTPLLVLYVLIIVTLAYGLYVGLESVARVSEVVFVIMLVASTIFSVGLLDSIHTNAFLPLFEQGWTGVLRGAFVPAIWYGQIILISLLLPYLADQKHPLRATMWGLLTGTIMLAIVLVLVIGVLGAPEAGHLLFGTLEVIRFERWGEFFQRLDLLFLFPWLMLMFLKSLISCTAGHLAFSQLLPVSNPRIMIIPMLTINLALTPWLLSDEIFSTQFLVNVWPFVLLTFEFILPATLLTADLLRGRLLKGGRSA